MSTTTHIRPHARLLCTALALVGLGALAAPPPSSADYGWPLRPFHLQHPVRGFFGDPRGYGHHYERGQIHFGIDISAPDGTPVYATLSGEISIHPLHPDTVIVRSGAVSFEYWHLDPGVESGHAIAYRTVIGRVGRGWAHVHFSERIGGVYVNPLRVGALAPYRDSTRPTVHSISFERDGTAVGRRTLGGSFDLVAEAYDDTPLEVPAPWNSKPVAPALVRWRIVGVTGWQTAADFRASLPSCFTDVYARWTHQNRDFRRSGRGRYRFLLRRAWNSRAVHDGTYQLEVAVSDTAGNIGRGAASFTVANGL
jgi:hypothetical protein